MSTNINMNAMPPRGATVNTLGQMQGMTGADGTKQKEIVSKAMEVLAGANIKVSQGDNTSATGNAERKTTGGTNVPALDNPADAKQVEANLAKLVAYLQLDNEERQTKMAKDRIDLNKAGLDNEHEGRMKQIDDSIKKMKDAEKAAKASRIFGWIGAVLSIVAAAVLTVVTGGAAAGFAIAGAALAVGSLIMNETGAMEKLVTALSDHLQDAYGMSKNDAKLAASLIINLSIMAAQLGCSIGSMVSGFASAAKTAADAAALGSKIAADTAKTSATAMQTAKTIQNIVTVASTSVGALSLASGGFSTYMTHRSDEAKADTTELEKFMTMLQQRLEESQEELQIILQQIEAGIGKIAELITSATDTSDEIAKNIGAMA